MSRQSVGNWWDLFPWIIVVVVLTAGYVTMQIWHPNLIADEGLHVPQIQRYIQGDWTPTGQLAMYPTFHAVTAIVIKFMGLTSIAGVRLVALLGGLLVITAFYRLRKLLLSENESLGLIEALFFPLIIPIFFVVYTDLWACAFVLLGVERALKGKIAISALAAASALLIRQDNIVWVVFIWATNFLQLHPKFSPREWLSQLQSFIWQSWYFLLILAAFIVFLFWNGGISSLNEQYHKIGIHLTNLWFWFVSFFFCFSPLVVLQFSRLVKTGKKLLIKWPVLVVVVVIGLTCWFTFGPSHQYNSPQLSFYVHNWLLAKASLSIVGKITTLVLIFSVLVVLINWQGISPLFLLSLATAFVFAMLHSFVEPRYCITGILILHAQFCFTKIQRNYQMAWGSTGDHFVVGNGFRSIFSIDGFRS